LPQRPAADIHLQILIMELRLEPKPVLAVCPNTAWQKTLRFEQYRAGEVNRASQVQENGGGKGVNLARVLQSLGFQVAVAGFAGGNTGQCLRAELKSWGCQDLLVECQAPTRSCYTVIDVANQQATELIEPAGRITQDEALRLQKRLQEAGPAFSVVCLCGSLPPGLDGAFYAGLARFARTFGLPVLLDSAADLSATLSVGVSILKINAAELQALSKGPDLYHSACALQDRYQIPWLGITAGPEQAWLFSSSTVYLYTVPRLPHTVSCIGAGDCASAILARRLAEEPEGTRMPEYFLEALACASASCLTDVPSSFAPATAEELRRQITCQEMNRT
jgi:tagatose 6-phosphate kinase